MPKAPSFLPTPVEAHPIQQHFHNILLMPPQVQLGGRVKSGKIIRRSHWAAADQLPVTEFRLSKRRLGLGERADGVVLFECPPCPYNTRIVPSRTLIQNQRSRLVLALPHLPPATCFSFPTYHLLTTFFSTTFPLSDYISFIFIYIPAKLQSFSQPSFVFNNIPASVRQKRNPSSRLVGFLEPQEKLSE
jgi:hypothetical protein